MENKDIIVHVKNEGEITRENENLNENESYRLIGGGIFMTLLCIGIGVFCVMIALEENEADEKNLIYLKGPIVYVFYLGVAILFCVGLCLLGSLCGQCCGDCCLIYSA